MNKEFFLKNKWRIFVILFLFSLSLNIFLFLKLDGMLFRTSQQYKFVKPLERQIIDSNVEEERFILHYSGLRQIIQEDINESVVELAGVFVQDVHTGAWLGINEKEGFVPGSLLKVPIMMAVLKKIEREEISLTDVIDIQASDIEPYSGELYKAGVGAKFTVWQLMKEMILASDNTAKNALKRQVSEIELNSVFAHAGIANPYRDDLNPTVTPRGYARFFKILYFSTFLYPEMSEKALDLTTDTQKEDLLSAGIPPEIQVAHKFGERTDGLHDCGIVYHNVNPYFLCVMTINQDKEDGKKLIASISKDVFEFVDKQ